MTDDTADVKVWDVASIADMKHPASNILAP